MSGQGRPRGRLQVFLEAAAGVGETFAMLGEARDLEAAWVDVVIGYLEPHGRRATADRASGLKVAPRRIARILRETDGVDVHIIADRGGRSGGPQR
jgi:K+-sensing histidine kinase KdpD